MRFAERRRAVGLSQERLAVRADVCTKTVQRIEAGRPCLPAVVAAIDRALAEIEQAKAQEASQ